MLIAVDGGGYTSACDSLYDGNHRLADDIGVAASGAGSGAKMAGSDTTGQTWAAQYDPAAERALAAACDLVDAYAHLANLTNTSLVNHKSADGAAMVSGAPVSSVGTGDSNAGHYTSSLALPSPVSAFGGTGEVPSWWHWIASHVEGLLWPDADTDRLRSVGSAWTKASQAVSEDSSYAESAVGALAIERSPEIATATKVMQKLEQHTQDLSSAFAEIGKACDDYAQHVEDAKRDTLKQLAEFIGWTAGIQIGGALLGAVTFGLGEGAAQAAEAAEVANAAAKVVAILQKLGELAETVATAIGTALSRISALIPKIKVLLIGGKDAAEVEEAAEEIPTMVFSRTRAPGIAGTFDDAVANGAPTRLNRVDAATRDANRRAALRGQPPAPAGQSLDEYPFASTAQGGEGSTVHPVPEGEQSHQGGVMSQFYGKNHIQPGDPFNVRFDP